MVRLPDQLTELRCYTCGQVTHRWCCYVVNHQRSLCGRVATRGTGRYVRLPRLPVWRTMTVTLLIAPGVPPVWRRRTRCHACKRERTTHPEGAPHHMTDYMDHFDANDDGPDDLDLDSPPATHPAPPVAYQRARIAVDLYEAWHGSTGSWPSPTDPPDLAWPDDAAVGVAIDSIMAIRRRDIDAGLPACIWCGCTPNAACHGGCAWLPADIFDGPTCSSCGKECLPIDCSDPVEVDISAVYSVHSPDDAWLHDTGAASTLWVPPPSTTTTPDPAVVSAEHELTQLLRVDRSAVTVDTPNAHLIDVGMRDSAGSPITVGCTVDHVRWQALPDGERFQAGIVAVLDMDGTVRVQWPGCPDHVATWYQPQNLTVTARPK